jgi:hypothetical protein
MCTGRLNLHTLHALHELLGLRFIAPACAAGAVAAHGVQASGMKKALAAATLRHNMHLKREQERIRTADFAKMSEGTARGARLDVLLGGGGGDLHPLQQRAAMHLFQVSHAVNVVLPQHVVAWGENANELGALRTHAHERPAAGTVQTKMGGAIALATCESTHLKCLNCTRYR